MSKSTSIPRENIIVIHPSSTKLRFGRSNDPEPITIPHCIARKAKDPSTIIRQPMIPDNRINTFMNTKFNNAIKLASIAMKSSPIESLQPFKEQPTINELLLMNKQHLKLELLNDLPDSSCSPVIPFAEFYIGKEALDLSPDSKYSVFWPFWGDKISDKYSRTAAVKDLEDIWRTAFEQSLRIPASELPNCRVILVIPDLLVRCELRWLADMLLTQLRFGSLVLQQENVCVTYSTGLPTACVVSMHDNSISVSCVEEGISIPEGRVKLLYGVGDVLCLFHCLLVRIGLPRVVIDSYTDYWSVMALRDMFESACALIPSPERKVSSLKATRRLIDDGRAKRQSMEMFISTEAIIASLALFHPALICKDSPKFQLQPNLCDESEPDDPFDDLYLTLTSRDRKKQRLLDDSGNSNHHHHNSAVSTTNNNCSNNNIAVANDDAQSFDDDAQSKRISSLIEESPGSCTQQNDTGKALPLNDAIVKSIHRSLSSTQVVIDNGNGGNSGSNNGNANSANAANNTSGGGGLVETSQQLCSVILAGELLEFPGCVEWLQNALRHSLAQCGEVEVIHNDFTDGVPAHSAAWKGATMITLVGYCDDLWVSASDWNKYGSRAIREKAPFLW